MTDAEIVELAIRRAIQGHEASIECYWLLRAADEIAKLVKERRENCISGMDEK